METAFFPPTVVTDNGKINLYERVRHRKELRLEGDFRKVNETGSVAPEIIEIFQASGIK